MVKAKQFNIFSAGSAMALNRINGTMFKNLDNAVKLVCKYKQTLIQQGH